MFRVAILSALLMASGTPLLAEVTRWEVVSREPYQNGKPLGERGAYERLRGRVYYAIDPKNEHNRQIIDLDLAPRNERQRVEFYADFEMLVPVDRSKGNGAVFYEVNNRGRNTAQNLIDGGGEEFLCRQGFVVLWSGWIAEVQPGAGRWRLQAPMAEENGKPIRGTVRNEFILDKAATTASIAHRANLGSFRPAADAVYQAILSYREREADVRNVIPRADWKYVISDAYGEGFTGEREKGQLLTVEIEFAEGFKPGFIYEVIYEAEGAPIQGVGMAAIRDIVSSLKFGTTKETNPLLNVAGKPLVNRALGFGTSQSGRLLRHFLWEGFNCDEQGRPAFDGVISHVAGGGLGSFNHRFASPTRTNGQHDEHLFPADYFPFAYGDERDPHTGKTDGILRRSRMTKTTPKVFHTQSSSEYWHRAGSLVHTDPLGERDSVIPPEVRIYSFGGTNHGSGGGVPGGKGNGLLPASPADYRPFMRALVVALDAWVRDDKEPPPSIYPRLKDQTLAGWKQADSGWPKVPGVSYPQVIHEPRLLDRGPWWESKGIATIEPPEIKQGYVVRVPAINPDGNERGTLNVPGIQVPVGSYTSFNLRSESIGAAGELLHLTGGYVPLTKTKAERTAAGDPRSSLEELYSSYSDYEARYLASARELVEQRYLLAEDLPRLKNLCEKFKGDFGNRGTN